MAEEEGDDGVDDGEVAEECVEMWERDVRKKRLTMKEQPRNEHAVTSLKEPIRPLERHWSRLRLRHHVAVEEVAEEKNLWEEVWAHQALA